MTDAGADVRDDPAREGIAMATDPARGTVTTPTDTPRRDIRPGRRNLYLASYIALGIVEILLITESIASRAWWRLFGPVLLLALAIGNLAALQAGERKLFGPPHPTSPDPGRPRQQ
jgi:hypothetical protein